ncbi:MAG TPA: aldolase/citrate lyase family protein [bacterium]|nr:aldolase/citrate lyase family protein [bacterium]HPQ18456.1 aldolase/citrate lyase family protein [bacterium]
MPTKYFFDKSIISYFKKKISFLKRERGLYALKAGTEVEDMNFDEIAFFRKISDKLVPLIVKIGGPEARNDIRECIKNKVDVIVAPMIESEYSFINFYKSFLDLKPENLNIKFSINIETITAVKNLNQIINNKYFKNISSVIIGRTDLAGSMGLDVDDECVYKTCKKIISSVKAKDPSLFISIGGKIKFSNIEKIITYLKPELINTRNIVFKVSEFKSFEFIKEYLSFEIELYKHFKNCISYKKSLYEKRIKDNELRCK